MGGCSAAVGCAERHRASRSRRSPGGRRQSAQRRSVAVHRRSRCRGAVLREACDAADWLRREPRGAVFPTRATRFVARRDSLPYATGWHVRHVAPVRCYIVVRAAGARSPRASGAPRGSCWRSVGSAWHAGHGKVLLTPAVRIECSGCVAIRRRLDSGVRVASRCTALDRGGEARLLYGGCVIAPYATGTSAASTYTGNQWHPERHRGSIHADLDSEIQTERRVDSLTTALGQAVARRRRRMGLSWRVLGERAEVSANTIRNLERGVRRCRVDIVVRVARALEIPAWRLVRAAERSLGRDGRPRP